MVLLLPQGPGCHAGAFGTGEGASQPGGVWPARLHGLTTGLDLLLFEGNIFIGSEIVFMLPRFTFRFFFISLGVKS